jgi:hypothetical protein
MINVRGVNALQRNLVMIIGILLTVEAAVEVASLPME